MPGLGHDKKMSESTPPTKPLTVLVADDDESDRLMIRDAMREAEVASQLHFVENGEEMMDYLLRRNSFASPEQSPRPDLILMDLNMPNKDGRQALREIKANPALRSIPVVALSGSSAEEDIEETYALGVSSFVAKPLTFAALVRTFRILTHYWLEVVKLPGRPR